MRWNATTRFPIEVQFEDIDGGGVVHHPNYLKYLERARCQAMREIGVPFEQCLIDGIAFVVAECHGKYMAPLKFGDKVIVETQLVAVRKSSLKVYQKIVQIGAESEPIVEPSGFLKANRKTYFLAQLRLVTVDLKTGQPVTLPESMRRAGQLPTQDDLNLRPEWMDVRLQPFSDL